MTINIQHTDRQSDVQHDHAVRMTQVLQQFASMLVGRKVGVRLSDKTIAPAWSTHNTIEFCEAQLADLTTIEGVLSARGLSFHELAHILFTPRTQSDIHRWVVDNGHWQAFNALEDQRIETLLVGQYQAIAPWLTATMAQYLLDNPEAVQRAFPLIRGRKYLPVEVRAIAKQSYVDQSSVAELSAIVDEYRMLVFPADTERAKPLIERFAELVKNAPQHGDSWSVDPNGHENRPQEAHQSSVKDKPASQREQERARDKAKAQDAETESEDEFQWAGDDQPADTNNEPADSTDSTDSDSDSADSDADSTDSTDSDADSADADETTDGQSDGQSDSDSSDSDADNDSDSDSDSTSETPAPNAGDAPKVDADDVAKALSDVLDSIKETLGQTLAEDIAKFGGDVVLEGVQVAQPRKATSWAELPSGEAVQASVAFRTELERIKAQYDPAWEFKTRKGRLNPVRYAKGYDISEVFDKFEYGRDDAVDIEAVILLDTSGSMGAQAQRALESAWGIKRALDGVGASTTVIGFDTTCSTLYSADEQATSVVKTVSLGGGTSPLSGLQFANYQLAVSDRSTKVLFVITDGQWSDAERANNIIQNLRDGGVLTALAYIETGAGIKTIEEVDAHRCEAIAHVNNASDLAEVGRAVVNLAIARNLVDA